MKVHFEKDFSIKYLEVVFNFQDKFLTFICDWSMPIGYEEFTPIKPTMFSIVFQSDEKELARYYGYTTITRICWLWFEVSFMRTPK